MRLLVVGQAVDPARVVDGDEDLQAGVLGEPPAVRAAAVGAVHVCRDRGVEHDAHALLRPHADGHWKENPHLVQCSSSKAAPSPRFLTAVSIEADQSCTSQHRSVGW